MEPVSGTAIEVLKRLQVKKNISHIVSLFKSICIHSKKILFHQINVVIKKEESIEAFNALSDTFYDHPMYFPLFWLEEGAYLDDENADLLKDLVRLFV